MTERASPRPSRPWDEQCAAAAVRVEQELTRLIEGFAQEHAVLVRQACRIPDDVQDLNAVVLTTLFGHTLDRMRTLHGRAHTERVTVALLDQLDRAHALDEAPRRQSADREGILH